MSMVPVWPGALVLLLALMPERVHETLAWSRAAIAAGEWWRLWSGHFVHFGGLHALADGGALLAAAVCAPAALRGPHSERRAVIAFTVAPVLLSLGLWVMMPEMALYRGASGLAVMSVVAVCVACLRGASGMVRAVSAACLLGLVAKSLVEIAGGWAGAVLPSVVVVAWPAHVLGAALGLLWALTLPRVVVGKT